MPLITGNFPAHHHFSHPPRGIISLVPSLTELLSDLHLDDEVVGITKFCTRPQHWFQTKQRVGGTKDLRLEIIHSLQPDLIIASKEENTREQIEELASLFPVLLTDIHDLPSALEAMLLIGELVGRQEASIRLTTQIKTAFDALPQAVGPAIAYFIWKQPFMVAGGDTFIHDMIQRAGFTNAFDDVNRYPEITSGDLTDRDIRFLFLSSEPYPFSEKHFSELQENFPGIRPVLVDGEFFSWYGSRLLQAPAYFEQLRAQVLSLTDAGRIR